MKMTTVSVHMTGHCTGCNSPIAATLPHQVPDVPGGTAVCTANAPCAACGTTVHITGTAHV